MKNITILGRRWFNTRTGNTYHSASILIDGNGIEGIHYAYGYGDQYLFSAMGKLSKDGVIDWNGTEPLWIWAERNGIKLNYSGFDVNRKKDLNCT